MPAKRPSFFDYKITEDSAYSSSEPRRVAWRSKRPNRREALRITSIALVLSLLIGNVAEAGMCFRGGGLFRGRFMSRGHHRPMGCGTTYVGRSGGYGGCQVSYGGMQQHYAAPQSITTQYATPQCAPPQATTTIQSTQTVATVATQTTTVAGDPYGFLAQLNAQRAARGLAPVAFSYDCYADACQNNRFQRVRGLGHFFMGRARRQNAGMGYRSASQVLIGWMNSPGHAAALFDPTIRVAAVAQDGGAWTFSAY